MLHNPLPQSPQSSNHPLPSVGHVVTGSSTRLVQLACRPKLKEPQFMVLEVPGQESLQAGSNKTQNVLGEHQCNTVRITPVTSSCAATEQREARRILKEQGKARQIACPLEVKGHQNGDSMGDTYIRPMKALDHSRFGSGATKGGYTW